MIITTAYLWAWLRAFGFTQAVEFPIYRRLLPASRVESLAASTITHPAVWFIFPLLELRAGWTYVSMVVAAELFAWWGEALWFWGQLRLLPVERRPSFVRCLVVAFVANGASLGLGLLARALVGVP